MSRNMQDIALEQLFVHVRNNESQELDSCSAPAVQPRVVLVMCMQHLRLMRCVFDWCMLAAGLPGCQRLKSCFKLLYRSTTVKAGMRSLLQKTPSELRQVITYNIPVGSSPVSPTEALQADTVT